MYIISACLTSIAFGVVMLASVARAVEVYAPPADVTVTAAIAPPEVVVVRFQAPTSEPAPDTPRIQPTPEPTPEPLSPVLMALVRSTPNPTPVAASRTAAAVVAEPVRAPVTLSARVAAIYDALARSSWPSWLWDKVVDIARCESTYNPLEVGDSGRALGLLQIRSDAHPDLVARFNVMTLDGNLAAAWLVYLRKGEMLGLPEGQGSLSPWSCA